MNKKEMAALVEIISEMKYSNNSVPEVMDYADRLLHMFPKLRDSMSCGIEAVLEDNIVENIGITLRRNNNPLALHKYDNKDMIDRWVDTKYTILWDFVDIHNTTLQELDELTKEDSGVKEVITSSEWKTAVDYHCDSGEFLAWCTKLL